MADAPESVHKVNKRRAKKPSFYELPVEKDPGPRYEATDNDLPLIFWYGDEVTLEEE